MSAVERSTSVDTVRLMWLGGKSSSKAVTATAKTLCLLGGGVEQQPGDVRGSASRESSAPVLAASGGELAFSLAALAIIRVGASARGYFPHTVSN